MAWPKGKPRPPNSGRKPGSLNKQKTDVGIWARSVVEDPEVRAHLSTQARQGTLSPPILQMFFHYAYGKPREQQPDDQAFIEDLLATVLKHVGTPEARQEIREVIHAHARPTSLRVVA